jgi:hypothetical protein
MTEARDSPLLTHVEFRSSLFPGQPGEEEAINPGLFGKQLAEFLRVGLRARGFAVRAPEAEDWGWRLEIENPEFPLWIGCGHQFGEADDFLCFIEPSKPTIKKLFRTIHTRSKVEALQQALDAILSAEPGVRDRRWSTAQEFERRP